MGVKVDIRRTTISQGTGPDILFEIAPIKKMGFKTHGLAFSEIDRMIAAIMKTCRSHNISVHADLSTKYQTDSGPSFHFKNDEDFVMARFVF